MIVMNGKGFADVKVLQLCEIQFVQKKKIKNLDFNDDFFNQSLTLEL